MSTVLRVLKQADISRKIFEGTISDEQIIEFIDTKPVERAFSLVKTWLREHEEQATQDPVEWLNRAFEHFASGGPGAGSLLGHWDMYFKLRKIYEEENA
ncbi:hypothetical protein B484DRAFT_393904 [Ochromonadaceae sp. CCMP2298]|nr:hypothetical protein B484DRAFT_393904 [Ochromonadaceae sp. CCMP2298]